MFTPSKPVSVSKSIRLESRLAGRLEQEARKRDMSFNQLIAQCCQYALDSLAAENPGPSDPDSKFR